MSCERRGRSGFGLGLGRSRNTLTSSERRGSLGLGGGGLDRCRNALMGCERCGRSGLGLYLSILGAAAAPEDERRNPAVRAAALQ
jgi:hypothetical protein